MHILSDLWKEWIKPDLIRTAGIRRLALPAMVKTSIR